MTVCFLRICRFTTGLEHGGVKLTCQTQSMPMAGVSLKLSSCCSSHGLASLLPYAAVSFMGLRLPCYLWIGHCSCSLYGTCWRREKKQLFLWMSTGGCADIVPAHVRVTAGRDITGSLHARHPVWPSMQALHSVGPFEFCILCHCILHLHCRCAVYVQDICSIVSHIISRRQTHKGRSAAAAEQAEHSSSSCCVLADLPHCIYNMVSQGRHSAVQGSG